MKNPTVRMVKGTEFRMGWRFENNDSTPKDLTGYSVLVQIKNFKWSTTFLAEYTEESGQITFDEEGGSVDLLIPASETATLPFDSNSAMIDCLVYTEEDGDRSPAFNVIFDTGVSNVIEE